MLRSITKELYDSLTPAPLSVVQKLISQVTTAGVVPLCVVTDLITSCLDDHFVKALYEHRCAFVHI